MRQNFPHGLMFHQFCNERHPRGQGAVNAGEFEAILRFVGLERILPAQEWLARLRTGRLEPHHCCLTFDDNLRCQYDVALPVMQRLGLTGFWFVYTSTFLGLPDQLEMYRYYRTVCFDTVDAFYEAFLAQVRRSPWRDKFLEMTRDFVPAAYLREFPFYTDGDRWFRFVRDKVLGPDAYASIMDRMLEASGLDIKAATELLWMNGDCIARLVADGHVVGLHSHTHPTELAVLPRDAQKSEYDLNRRLLIELSGMVPVTAAHPCNSYTSDTLEILRESGVELAFRSNMAAGAAKGPLEFPREDHANILSAMAKAA